MSANWQALQQGFRERVTDIEQPHIRELPRVLPALFVAAAERARRAGFDGVELHYRARLHHGLVSLALERPRRTATAAISRAALRLPLEVSRAVRAAWAAISSSAAGC